MSTIIHHYQLLLLQIINYDKQLLSIIYFAKFPNIRIYKISIRACRI